MHCMQYIRAHHERENMEFIINRSSKAMNSPLSIVEVGHSHPRDGKHVELISASYQLHYIVRGSGYFQNQPVHSGVGFLVVPGDILDMQVGAIGFEQYWVNFNGSEVHNLLYSSGVPVRTHLFSYAANEAHRDMILSLLSDVFRPDAENKQPSIRHTHLYLTGLLYQLLSAHALDNTAPLTLSEHYVETVCSFIRSHYSEELTMSQLSAIVGLSPKYLSRVFRQVTGCTVMQYLTDTRLDVACHLLLHTGKSIGEIASCVGYGDALYFSKVFHAAHGISPSKWRQQQS